MIRNTMMQLFLDWLGTLQWERLVPEMLGKALGFLAGFAASWFLLFRRRLNAIQRMQTGDSDDFVFQAHRLVKLPDDGDSSTRDGSSTSTDKQVLLFRNVAPKISLNDLYDNVAIRDAVKKLADQTSLNDPILKTESTLGFELLNDALGHIAGLLAITAAPRETWLFIMTCEDRQVVRKQCIRCFLIRPQDLEMFLDWEWCTGGVMVEKPWHWFRIVALHRIACAWREEQRIASQQSADAIAKKMPLVDKHVRHDRIRMVSIGLYDNEKLVGQPCQIDWATRMPELMELGVKVEAIQTASEGSKDEAS